MMRVRLRTLRTNQIIPIQTLDQIMRRFHLVSAGALMVNIRSYHALQPWNKYLISVGSTLTFTFSCHCCFHTRPEDTETEKEEEHQGGQAAQDSVHC